MRTKLLPVSLLSIIFLLFSQAVLAATSYEMTVSSRAILRINPGATIDAIIHRVYPRDEVLWPEIKKKLIAINPLSFQPNSETLIHGARLQLIDIKRIYEREISHKNKVGFVARQTGKAGVKDINGYSAELEVDAVIFEGDRISTGKGAALFIEMDDGAKIYLKENTVIKVSEYIITSGFGKDSSSVLELLKGGLRKITGSIGASAFSNYKLQTGLATIGIRGTEYVIKLCKRDDCSQTISRNDPDAKLHAAVLEGSITLTSDEDVQILMALGEYGTATSGELLVHDNVDVPAGLFNAEEARQFNTIKIKQVNEVKAEEQSSSFWSWFLAIALVAVAL